MAARTPTATMHRVIDRTRTHDLGPDRAPYPRDRARDLAKALKARLTGEVRFADVDRALYATDASNYRQTPIGVVLPRSAEDAVAAMAVCRDFEAPVLPRGGGTSLAGETCNAAVVIDFSKYMRRVLNLDPAARQAEVEPGCVLDTLRDAAEKHALTFGPDPATHSRNTLGGMIGNDSCGVHSIMAGRTADNVAELEILTYDGLRMTVGATSREDYRRIQREGGRRAQIYRELRAFWARYGARFEARYPDIPRRISGYENLDQLSWDKGFNVARALVGTEAGCAMVLKAKVDLVPSPQQRVLAILGFKDVFAAADAVCEALSFGPIALEGIDDLLIDYMTRKHLDVDDVKALPDGAGWLLAEFGDDMREAAEAKAQAFTSHFKRRGCTARVLVEPREQAKIWQVREDGLAATAHVPGLGETYPGWEDSAVRREDLGRYLRDLKRLFHKHGYEASVYGHFGDGLVHCRVNFDLRSTAGVKEWLRFLGEAADLVVSYGGSLSGEHGDGQARAALLEKMYGPELMQAQRAFKAIWDPEGRMNPGKVIDPYPIESNLRTGPDYAPPRVRGLFALEEDGGDFAKATERCVGVGACRKPHSDGQVMCPSYMVTQEEKHSTRGRARLLFEMLRGDPVDGGWRSDEVEEALNLCLACKGCKHDCPVHVDMATYKAEFRARHYEGRLRPRPAYAMGQIRQWAEIAAHVPWLANLAIRTPGVSNLAKAAGGLAQARTIPAFAPQTFRTWWKSRPLRPGGGPRVILWPDTFNDFFRPETAKAAVQVLEGLGYRVELPAASLCCGRPLYDWGWIDQARALWRRTLNVLADDIAEGTPIIGLEPACVSAFRDELPGLFPDDPAAAKLSRQTQFLTEFLAERGQAPKLAGQAHVLEQLHCHHHAVLDAKAEASVLEACGADAEVLPSGCCGMAGAFGFEADKYDISIASAERVLLPALRAAPRDAVVLANGFSCREQIEQTSGRPTLHVAELLAQASAPGRQAG